jgi:hypothetical protein
MQDSIKNNSEDGFFKKVLDLDISYKDKRVGILEFLTGGIDPVTIHNIIWIFESLSLMSIKILNSHLAIYCR